MLAYRPALFVARGAHEVTTGSVFQPRNILVVERRRSDRADLLLVPNIS
jgi:hypothetical protein